MGFLDRNGHLQHRRGRRVIRGFLAAGAVAVAVAGCGEDAPPREPASPPRSTAPPPPEDEFVRQVDLEIYRARPGGRTLDIVYGRGTDERFRRKIVREGPRAVRVTVEVISPVSQRHGGVALCTPVRLQRPLGHRRVLDGAGRRVPPVSRRIRSDPHDLLWPRRRCGVEG